MDYGEPLNGSFEGEGIQALLFDFNGTLCDDAHELVRIYREVAHEAGLTLPDSLIPIVIGLSDHDIFSELLNVSGCALDNDLIGRLSERRRDLYLGSIAGSPLIPVGRCQLIRTLASRVPLGVVSGAFSHEVKVMLSIAGLDDAITTVVGIDNVTRGKPDPEGWLLGLAKISDRVGQSIPPSRVLAIDDSVDGLCAARSAGMRTAAVSNGVLPPPRAEADLVLDALDQHCEATLLTVIETTPPFPASD